MADTTYELPIAINVSAGNVHDSKRAKPLSPRRATPTLASTLSMLWLTRPTQARSCARRSNGSTPPQRIIDPNPGHKKYVAKTEKTPDWKALFKRRTAVERVNARLKGFYKLNDARVRGHLKVTGHALLANIVLLGQAVACPSKAWARA